MEKRVSVCAETPKETVECYDIVPRTPASGKGTLLKGRGATYIQEVKP